MSRVLLPGVELRCCLKSFCYGAAVPSLLGDPLTSQRFVPLSVSLSVGRLLCFLSFPATLLSSGLWAVALAPLASSHSSGDMG